MEQRLRGRRVEVFTITTDGFYHRLLLDELMMAAARSQLTSNPVSLAEIGRCQTMGRASDAAFDTITKALRHLWRYA